METFVPDTGSPKVARAAEVYNRGKIMYMAGDASESVVLRV